MKSLTECKGLCAKQNDCTGVSFSNKWVAKIGTSACYLCNDNVTQSNDMFDVYRKTGIVQKKLYVMAR